jgi:hypothetical protein
MRHINVSKTLALAVAFTLLVCLVPLARANDELKGKPNVILILDAKGRSLDAFYVYATKDD